jgi:hypothetical protein
VGSEENVNIYFMKMNNANKSIILVLFYLLDSLKTKYKVDKSKEKEKTHQSTKAKQFL